MALVAARGVYQKSFSIGVAYLRGRASRRFCAVWFFYDLSACPARHLRRRGQFFGVSK